MIEKVQKITANYLLKPYLKWYLKSERFYNYNNRKIKIYPSVFHPKYFFSTGILLKFIAKLELKNKTFCEVGAGSGVISFRAHEKGAQVTALEINEVAVKGLEENYGNLANFKVIKSDLFDGVQNQNFDVLIINPPYFFNEIKDVNSLAWNCGLNGEYFHKLFGQLHQVTTTKSEIYIILAQNCEIERIKSIARDYNFGFTLEYEEKIKWEKNYIFKLNYL